MNATKMLPALLERAMAAAGAGLVITDAGESDCAIVYVNPGFCRMTGYTKAEVLGRNCRLLQGPGTDPVAVSELTAAVHAGRECRLTLRNYRQDGTSFWNEVWLSPVSDKNGRVVQFLGVQQDVSARVEAEQRIEHLAYHDALTGLLNRQALDQRLQSTVDAAERGGLALALLYIDLDGFKQVNDVHGHAAGDLVLREVAQRLSHVCRPGDVIARQGGDEFLILLPSLREQPDKIVQTFRDRVDAVLQSPFCVGGTHVNLGASIGTAIYPRDARTPDGLLGHADAKLYGSKAQRDRPHHSVSVSPEAGEAALLADIILARAVEPVYQPIIDLNSGAVRGYAALARGARDSRLERPDQLFSAAQRAGRLHDLDRLCQERAIECARAAGLREPLSLFVNVEPATVGPAPVPGENGATPDGAGIVWEITERALTERPAELIRRVEQLRSSGAAIALDDVGADVRSLALLPLLAPDVVKLDLRIIQQQPNAELAAIINAVAAYRESTGATVIAEGVETTEHLQMALAAYADLGQGWLFGRPQPLPQTLPWTPQPITRRRARPIPPPSDSPYEVIRARMPTKRMTKPMLLAISMQLEQQALAIGNGAVVAAAFQDASRFTPATRRRYAQLSERAALVVALGVGMDTEPLPGVRGATLAPNDVLLGEWSLAVIGPHFAGALVATDLGDDGPDNERRFDFALTYDRELVILAASALLRRVHPTGAQS